MKNDRWVQRWNVVGSRGDSYTVAIDKKGEWGCSCWAWRKSRMDCKHIISVKAKELSGHVQFIKFADNKTFKDDPKSRPLVNGNIELEDFGVRKVKL